MENPTWKDFSPRVACVDIIIQQSDHFEMGNEDVDQLRILFAIMYGFVVTMSIVGGVCCANRQGRGDIVDFAFLAIAGAVFGGGLPRAKEGGEFDCKETIDGGESTYVCILLVVGICSSMASFVYLATSSSRRENRESDRTAAESVADTIPRVRRLLADFERAKTTGDVRSTSLILRKFRAIGIRTGFVYSGVREKVWPLLARGEFEDKIAAEAECARSNGGARNRVATKDVNVILADVARSMNHFETTRNGNMSTNQREKLRKRLKNILFDVCGDENVYYYQGFHDVTSVLLLVCGEHEGRDVARSLSQSRLRDCMREDIHMTLQILKLIYPLIERFDPAMHRYLSSTAVESVFALPWFLTWFSHTIESVGVISRLFDFFLSTHPVAPVYFCAALLMSVRDTLLRDVECEMASILMFLKPLPSECGEVLEDLLRSTRDMIDRVPPSELLKTMKESDRKACHIARTRYDRLDLSPVDASAASVAGAWDVVAWLLAFPVAAVLARVSLVLV